MSTTVGCFGSHPEDRAMARGLDAYLDQQAAAERHEEAVAEYATQLCNRGEEFDPYGNDFHRTQFNMFEALAEIPVIEQERISGLFAKARESQVPCDYVTASRALDLAVRTYWFTQAKAVAERTLK